jgi:hypothetical protein
VLASGRDGRCQLDVGPALAAETARRLSCDAALVGVLEDAHGNPLDVGRKARSFPAAIRRAIEVRDRGTCCFPGCTRSGASPASGAGLDAHHVVHWSQGGATSLANGMLLCRLHHRALHEGGYRVEPTGGPVPRWRFHRPDGTVVPAAEAPLPPTDASAVVRHNEQLGLDISPHTAMPYWAGERLDVGLALDALFSAGRPQPASG